MRQVYFDPFGARLDGYRQGQNDEMELQRQTRQARAADWEHQKVAPLALAKLQREDTLGQAALPYDIRALGLRERINAANAFGAEQPWFERIGQTTGNYAPALTNATNFGQGAGYYTTSGDLFAPQVAANNAQLYGGLDPAQDEYESILGGYASQYGIDPTRFISSMRGNPFQVAPNMATGYDQFLNWDRARQTGLDQRQFYNDEWARQIQQQQMQNAIDQQAQSERWRQQQYNQWLYNQQNPQGGYTPYALPTTPGGWVE